LMFMLLRSVIPIVLLGILLPRNHKLNLKRFLALEAVNFQGFR
jgi:hypothetical protein